MLNLKTTQMKANANNTSSRFKPHTWLLISVLLMLDQTNFLAVFSSMASKSCVCVCEFLHLVHRSLLRDIIPSIPSGDVEGKQSTNRIYDNAACQQNAIHSFVTQ